MFFVHYKTFNMSLMFKKGRAYYVLSEITSLKSSICRFYEEGSLTILYLTSVRLADYFY